MTREGLRVIKRITKAGPNCDWTIETQGKRTNRKVKREGHSIMIDDWDKHQASDKREKEAKNDA